jgi:hypothetical protein
MVWTGHGEYNSYGYQNNPFVKGADQYILPNTVYQVQSRDPPQSATQFWIVPVDESGNPTGDPTLKTAGRVFYGIWEGWKGSEAVFMSDYWPGAQP